MATSDDILNDLFANVKSGNGGLDLNDLYKKTAKKPKKDKPDVDPKAESSSEKKPKKSRKSSKSRHKSPPPNEQSFKSPSKPRAKGLHDDRSVRNYAAPKLKSYDEDQLTPRHPSQLPVGKRASSPVMPPTPAHLPPSRAPLEQDDDKAYKVTPAVRIKATKLSDYLKQQGHEPAAGTSTAAASDDDDLPPAIASTSHEAKSALDQSKSAVFLPRTVKSGMTAATAMVDVFERPAPVEPPPPPHKTMKTELIKDNSRIIADARERIANQSNLDAMYKPPKMRRKTGHAPHGKGISDDESTSGGALAEKKEAPKGKIVIGKLKNVEAVKRPLVPYGKRKSYGEDGEIVQSEHESDSDGHTASFMHDDSDGELADSDHNTTAPSVLSSRSTVKRKHRHVDSSHAKSSRSHRSSRSRRDSRSPSHRDRRRRSRSRSDDRMTSASSRRSPSPPRIVGRGRNRGPVTDGDIRAFPWSRGEEETAYLRRKHSASPETLLETMRVNATVGKSTKSSSRRRSRSRDRHRRARRSKSRSHTPTPRDSTGRIDKAALLAIAKRNASAMLQLGTLQSIRNMSAEEIARLKAGGSSVEELVTYCRRLSRKERRMAAKANGQTGSDVSSDTDGGEPMDDHLLDDGGQVRHPFELKERAEIIFNIPNSLTLPTKTPLQRSQEEAQLRIAFPVSSGAQHKSKAIEWTPSAGTHALTSSGLPASALPPPPAPPKIERLDKTMSSVRSANGVIAAPLGGVSCVPAAALSSNDKVFDDVPQAPAESINDIVNKRLAAVKRLQENPNDSEAMKQLQYAEQQMNKWAEAKNLPGQFTGHTGVQCLSAQELGPSNPRYQSWAKKDQLNNAAPVGQGRGMALLMKMGWRPGEGIGKDGQGTLEPLMLDVKSDRRGVIAVEEMPASNRRGAGGGLFGALAGSKNPISLLMELCQKRRWHQPEFQCIEQGESFSRRFIWRCTVNGVEYQPAVPSSSKKAGKTQSAQVVLQSLGLVPKDPNLPVIIG